MATDAAAIQDDQATQTPESEQGQAPIEQTPPASPEQPQESPEQLRQRMLLEGQEFEDEGGGEPPAPPSDPSSPPEPVQERSFIDQLAELGFRDLEDEDQARARLLESYRDMDSRVSELQQRQQQLEQLSNYGKQYLELMQNPKFQEIQGGGAPAQPEPQTTQQSEPWWNPPKYDPAVIERYRQLDQNTGEYTWKENTPAQVRADAEAYATYMDNWAAALVSRPNEVLPPAVEQIITQDPNVSNAIQRLIDERVQAQLGSAFTEREEMEYFRSVEEENRDWLYARDPRTNEVARDPGGNPIFSEAGQQVAGYLEAAANMGIEDPRHRWQYAVEQHELAQLRSGRVQQNTAQQAQQTAEQRRMEHLQRGAGANNIPPRSGSIPPAENPGIRSQNPNLSAGEKLLDQMRADGADL